jgi:hypothetical protein
MENDYSYSDLTTSFFMISVMLAQMRCTRGDDVSPQASHPRKQEAMQVSKAGNERPARARTDRAIAQGQDVCRGAFCSLGAHPAA